MKSVAIISIVAANSTSLMEAKTVLCNNHLVAGITYNECTASYWLGGQLTTNPQTILRGITFYEKITEIEKVLPEDVTIISACPSTYVNPKTERWLNESIS